MHTSYFIQVVQDPTSHSISFAITEDESIVIEYDHDKETDMFQVCAFFFNHYIQSRIILQKFKLMLL